MNTEESCKCPACSDLLVFDIGKGLLCCPSCGTICDVEKYERALRMKKRPPRGSAPDADDKDVTCPNSGAVISPGVRALSVTCPCCGGFIQDKIWGKGNSRDASKDDSISDSAVNSIDSITPDLVIPFAHGREGFLKAFRDYSEKSPSLPDDLLGGIPPESIRPAYLPVLVYEALAAGDLSLEIRDENGRVSEGARIGHFNLRLRGLPEPLNDLPLKDPPEDDRPGNLCLEPRDLSRARPCRAAWFCGLRDQFGHTAPPEILRIRKSPDYEGIKRRIRDLCLRLLTSRKDAKITSQYLDISPRSIRYVFVPVWLFPVSYQGRTYLSVMNASSGKATITAPRSRLKSAAIALGFSSFCAGLMSFAFLLLTVPLLPEQYKDLEKFRFFILFLPLIMLVYLIYLKNYQFCRRHLFKGLASVLIASGGYFCLGLLMLAAFFAIAMPEAGSRLLCWAMAILIIGILSLLLFSSGDDFIYHEPGNNAFDSPLYPDRTDFDKRCIDLRESSAAAEIQRRGKTEKLPDPLAPLREPE